MAEESEEDFQEPPVVSECCSFSQWPKVYYSYVCNSPDFETLCCLSNASLPSIPKTLQDVIRASSVTLTCLRKVARRPAMVPPMRWPLAICQWMQDKVVDSTDIDAFLQTIEYRGLCRPDIDQAYKEALATEGPPIVFKLMGLLPYRSLLPIYEVYRPLDLFAQYRSRIPVNGTDQAREWFSVSLWLAQTDDEAVKQMHVLNAAREAEQDNLPADRLEECCNLFLELFWEKSQRNRERTRMEWERNNFNAKNILQCQKSLIYRTGRKTEAMEVEGELERLEKTHI